MSDLSHVTQTKCQFLIPERPSAGVVERHAAAARRVQVCVRERNQMALKHNRYHTISDIPKMFPLENTSCEDSDRVLSGMNVPCFEKLWKSSSFSPLY